MTGTTILARGRTSGHTHRRGLGARRGALKVSVVARMRPLLSNVLALVRTATGKRHAEQFRGIFL